MIIHEISELYIEGRKNTDLVICTDESVEITNEHIYQEGFELSESLCSQDELKFGCCETSELKLKIRNEFGNLKGHQITVSNVLNELTDYPLQIGVYNVETCERSGDRQYLDITAYDDMHKIINAEVVEWYDSVFPIKDTAQTVAEDEEVVEEDTPTVEYEPITLKEFRDSFFEYVDVTQETVALPQDDVLVEKTIDADSISGLKVISAICELNGVFGHINREGIFVYVSLKKPSEEGIIASDVEYNSYKSCEFEDFETKTIDKVQVRQEDGDIGYIYGTGDNCYIVQDNFLVFGKSTDDLASITETLYDCISGITYRPFMTEVQGNPCVEVGDRITVNTRLETVNSYVLNRNLKGIMSMIDSLETRGTEVYEEKVNSVQNDIKQLKGKSNILKRTVEETVSRVTNIEKGYTEIQQTAESLKVNVSQTQDDVERMSYDFTSEKLVIEKEGAETKTEISENGMSVKSSSDEEMLVANAQGVDATNLHAKTYLIVGSNSRFEDFGDGTGCFYIGGAYNG